MIIHLIILIGYSVILSLFIQRSIEILSKQLKKCIRIKRLNNLAYKQYQALQSFKRIVSD